MQRVYPDRTMSMAFAGTGEAKPGAHERMAVRALDVARRLGMPASIEASRCTVSCSRYLHLRTAEGVWMIRISNHPRPADTGQPTPHVDFVTRDGVTGEAALLGIIERIAAGQMAWFDAGHSRKGKR
ncbi:MAG: hypothetical protein K2X73_04600 [Sphingomonas sp.]|uniref:hypothetical protein n=1 Tax=Sphingomonas sp. TaxID=28214 RepID=UPI0025DA3BE6|nr:hypothetical protein [Sphingomonas sp.]MBX9881233.1 hypothetical protein [Sphingomonas sp.]